MHAGVMTLGTFGDERLSKRGACCLGEWWSARARAFAGLPGVAVAGLSDFLVFWPTTA